MQFQGRRFCQLAAVSLAVATIVSALAVHAFKPRLAPEHYETLQTAVRFQFYQSLGLFGVGLLSDRLSSRWLPVAGWLLFSGIVLFSGSLYLLLAGAPRLVGVLTPLGGLAMMLAWCLTAVTLSVRPTGVPR
jgi:uncharacterized membrane protein YgdD (TMEM256/DUF423 family)